MNATCIWFEEEMIVDYSVKDPKRDQQPQKPTCRHAHPRRGVRPMAYNGFHRRVIKRWN